MISLPLGKVSLSGDFFFFFFFFTPSWIRGKIGGKSSFSPHFMLSLQSIDSPPTLSVGRILLSLVVSERQLSSVTQVSSAFSFLSLHSQSEDNKIISVQIKSRCRSENCWHMDYYKIAPRY